MLEPQWALLTYQLLVQGESCGVCICSGGFWSMHLGVVVSAEAMEDPQEQLNHWVLCWGRDIETKWLAILDFSAFSPSPPHVKPHMTGFVPSHRGQDHWTIVPFTPGSVTACIPCSVNFSAVLCQRYSPKPWLLPAQSMQWSGHRDNEMWFCSVFLSPEQFSLWQYSSSQDGSWL